MGASGVRLVVEECHSTAQTTKRPHAATLRAVATAWRASRWKRARYTASVMVGVRPWAMRSLRAFMAVEALEVLTLRPRLHCRVNR